MTVTLETSDDKAFLGFEIYIVIKDFFWWCGTRNFLVVFVWLGERIWYGIRFFFRVLCKE